jgi:hypothetical protein
MPQYDPQGESPSAAQWLSSWGIRGATDPLSLAITRSEPVPGVPGESVAVTPMVAPQISPAGWMVSRPVVEPIVAIDVSLTVHATWDVMSPVSVPSILETQVM